MISLEDYLLSHPKKYVIFDFDDTLFHLELPWHVYRAEMSKRLRTLDPSVSARLNIADLENTVTQRWGEEAAKIRRTYSLDFEQNNLRGVKELSDLTDFIRKHCQDYHFYLWTSNMRETVEPILEKAGLTQCFSQLVTKGDVMLMKPYPDGFYQIYDPLRHDKIDFLMVGNSANDREAASRAGIDFYIRQN